MGYQCVYQVDLRMTLQVSPPNIHWFVSYVVGGGFDWNFAIVIAPTKEKATELAKIVAEYYNADRPEFREPVPLAERIAEYTRIIRESKQCQSIQT